MYMPFDPESPLKYIFLKGSWHKYVKNEKSITTKVFITTLLIIEKDQK